MKVAATTTTTATAGLELPTTAAIGHGYEMNLNYLLAEQSREEYLRLYTLLQQLGKVHVSGVQQVTLTGYDGSSATVPLFGANDQQRGGTLYVELAEVLGDRLAALEKNILRYEQDSQENEPQEREGEGPRQEALNYCLPMRRMSPAEFAAMPAEARRAYDPERAEQLEAA